MHRAVEAAFARTFEASHRTRLEGGADEPLYAPADGPGEAHVIYYREDFVSSALHEVAHWCVASQTRRQLRDYGYWYDGDRGSAAQRDFETVEVEPQALEWIFTAACGLPFRESSDNLAFPEADTSPFRARIARAVWARLAQGLPARAARFTAALERAFGGDAKNPRQYR